MFGSNEQLSKKRFSSNESGNVCPCNRCCKEVPSLAGQTLGQLKQTWPKEIVVMSLSCLLLLVVAIREAEYSFVCLHLSWVQLRLAFFPLSVLLFFSLHCLLSSSGHFFLLSLRAREREREKERSSDEVVVIHSFLSLSVCVFAHHHHHHCCTREEEEESEKNQSV